MQGKGIRGLGRTRHNWIVEGLWRKGGCIGRDARLDPNNYVAALSVASGSRPSLL